MKMSEIEAWERLGAAMHGVLGTVHPERGIDLVPVVYAIDEQPTLFVPTDTVKAKTTTRLQRLENLRNDPRCTLLVDDYDQDWLRLWWVRINGRGVEAEAEELQRFLPLLADRYRQYTDPSTVVGGIVIRPTSVTGWSARA